jgi:transposase
MHTTIDPKKYDLFVGIDTSKKSYSMTMTDHDQIRRSFKSSADPEKVYNFFRKRYADQRLLFVYEAGCTGYGLYDYLVGHGEECLLVHPASVKKAPNDRVKNNRTDSAKLAEQAAGGQLDGIRVPSDAYRKLRHLCATRQAYAQDSRRAKQRIQSLLLFESVHVSEEFASAKRWSKKHRSALRLLPLTNEVVQLRLHALLDDLEYAEKRLLWVHKELRLFIGRETSIQRNISLLRSIPGFGFVVSSYFLSRIGDPINIRNVREIGSFAGLVPSENLTGEKTKKGEITRMGDRELRRLLVEGAWASIRKDTELCQFYNRVKSRNSKDSASQIAIVAVARKLTMRAHTVLKEQRAYFVR